MVKYIPWTTAPEREVVVSLDFIGNTVYLRVNGFAVLSLTKEGCLSLAYNVPDDIGFQVTKDNGKIMLK